MTHRVLAEGRRHSNGREMSNSVVETKESVERNQENSKALTASKQGGKGAVLKLDVPRLFLVH